MIQVSISSPEWRRRERSERRMLGAVGAFWLAVFPCIAMWLLIAAAARACAG